MPKFIGPDFDYELASDDELKQYLQRYGVHYSLNTILNMLEPESTKDKTIQILLGKFYQDKLKAPSSIPPPLFRHPIISIDGFFTHGRTKVAKMVASALNGRRMLMPTRHIARLRGYITDETLRKQYYALAKYMGANMATLYCRTAPVILERYWHDQVAYVIAKSFESKISSNSSIYDFPKDLLVPDLMFFVTGALDPKEYNESTVVNHINNEMALRIAEASRKIRPKPIEIGPPSLPSTMVKKILAVVDQFRHRFLSKPLHRPNWRNN
ncbi:uncharacterized protein LOC129004261 [Macrosteles quadrilineatus]|uniref:uncharacterized protein LOC129004090 n=1 Tax=Macrosteles quadrilineatus TaxID=74068 RepID=UPI0023E2BA12|nr:uncharacterized protein LOC129004090 [Macrosteles quadrilineatus]XP_054288751.1 uncharacterized protein LOC129004261 [Macrosteles quadrilineatus]